MPNHPSQPDPGPSLAANKGKGRVHKALAMKDMALGRTKPSAKGKAPMKCTRPKTSKELVDNSSDDKGKGEDSSDGGVIHMKLKLVDKELVNFWVVRRMGAHAMSTHPHSARSHWTAMSVSLQNKNAPYTRGWWQRAGEKGWLWCCQPWLQSSQVSYHFGNTSNTNVLLATLGMPKELAQKFDEYETQANSHCKELKELAKEVVALRSQNLAVCWFCTECLITMYKKMTTCDAKTTEALCLILTMHRNKACLNMNFCQAIHQLEALVGQPPAPLPSFPFLPPPSPSIPLSPNPNNNQSNAGGAKSASLTTDIPTIIEASKKRGK